MKQYLVFALLFSIFNCDLLFSAKEPAKEPTEKLKEEIGREDAYKFNSLLVPDDIWYKILMLADDKTICNSKLVSRQMCRVGSEVTSACYPVFQAASQNDVDKLKLLIASGVNIHEYKNNLTPIMVSIYNKSRDAFTLLKKNGAAKSIIQDLHDLSIFVRFLLFNLLHYKKKETTPVACASGNFPEMRLFASFDKADVVEQSIIRPAGEYLKGKNELGIGQMTWYVKSSDLLIGNTIQIVRSVLESGVFSIEELQQPYFCFDDKSISHIELLWKILPHDVFEKLPLIVVGKKMSSSQMMRVIWQVCMHLFNQLDYLSCYAKSESGEKLFENYESNLALLDLVLKSLGV